MKTNQRILDAQAASQTASEIVIRNDAEKGRYIALLLGLKRKAYKYDTAWGTKTDYGLYHTIKRIIEEPMRALPDTFEPDELNNL